MMQRLHHKWESLQKLLACCNATARFVGNFFIDLKLITVLMLVWLSIVLFIMVEIGVFSNSNFVAFGPRKELTFMHVSVDTQYKYGMLVSMIILHTFISDFISDSLNPQLLNSLQNTSSRYLPYSPRVYYTVTTIWAFYCGISQLFLIFIAFAQLDLLLVRLLSDICANFVTSTIYMQDKIYDPVKFFKFEEQHMHRASPPSPRKPPNHDDDGCGPEPAPSELMIVIDDEKLHTTMLHQNEEQEKIPLPCNHNSSDDRLDHRLLSNMQKGRQWAAAAMHTDNDEDGLLLNVPRHC